MCRFPTCSREVEIPVWVGFLPVGRFPKHINFESLPCRVLSVFKKETFVVLFTFNIVK